MMHTLPKYYLVLIQFDQRVLLSAECPSLQRPQTASPVN